MKYAATVKANVENHDDNLRYRLTALPSQYIEYFLYREGFEDVYRKHSAIPENVPISPRRIIDKAIHRSLKPDLAIDVAQAASLRGTSSIPPFLRQMFSRVAWLARGRAD